MSRGATQAAPAAGAEAGVKGGAKGGPKGHGRGGGYAGGAPSPGSQPSAGTGSIAVSKLLGTWEGNQGETYEVGKDWSVLKKDAVGAARKYQLAWSGDRSAILWGERFCLYTSDFTSVGPAKWYRCEDRQKERCAFTWQRPDEPASLRPSAKSVAAPLGVRPSAPAAAAGAPSVSLVRRPADPSSSSTAPVRPPPVASAGAGGKALSSTAVLAQLLGPWAGNHGDTYEVHGDWSCEKQDVAGASRKYQLSWHAARAAVFWGERFCLYAVDVTSEGPALWYRAEDRQKSQCAFRWSRPPGAATTKSRPIQPPPSVVSTSSGFVAQLFAREAAEAPFRKLAARSPSQSAALRKAAESARELVPEPALPADELERSAAALTTAPRAADGSASAAPPAELLRRLVGAWWGPRDTLFRIFDWSCEMTDVHQDCSWQLDLAWHSSAPQLLWGRAFACAAADLAADELNELRWRWQPGAAPSSASDEVVIVWARHVEEGEQ